MHKATLIISAVLISTISGCGWFHHTTPLVVPDVPVIPRQPLVIPPVTKDPVLPEPTTPDAVPYPDNPDIWHVTKKCLDPDQEPCQTKSDKYACCDKEE